MKKIISLLFIASFILLGCSQGTTYTAPAQVPQQEDNNYVGGGCEIASQADYSEPLIKAVSAV